MFCFIGIMESSVNANMKNPPLNVGVIIPPNDHYKPVLYSHEQASRQFNQLDHDIYYSIKKSEKANKHKTPKSVFWVLGLTALAIAFPFLKKLLFH